MTPVDSFIRAQGTACAIVNMLVNPAVAWLTNPRMRFVPLVGANSIVVDTAATSIVLSLLVALFAAASVRRAMADGRLDATGGSPRAGRWLSRLPRRSWLLGLVLGLGAACFVTALVFALLHALGMSGLPFAVFAAGKALYTGALGYLMTRWAIVRNLLAEAETIA